MSALSEDEEVDALRFVPMPRRRKILRLRPPSGRRGMRFDSGISVPRQRAAYVAEQPARDHCGPSQEINTGDRDGKDKGKGDDIIGR